MKALTTLVVATFIAPTISLAHLAPEVKFEKQILWKTMTAKSNWSQFAFHVLQTHRGTYRVKPEAEDFEFPAELNVTKIAPSARDFTDACKDIYGRNRFEEYGKIFLEFDANPYSEEYVLSDGTRMTWDQFENPQDITDASPIVEWNNSAPESDIETTWLKEPQRAYRQAVVDFLKSAFERRKDSYFKTGSMEFDLGTDPALRIFACDLARGRAKLSLKFKLEGEPAMAEITDWIGNVNLKAIHDDLQETGDRPEVLSLFEAGIAMGQSIQQSTKNGLAVFQNDRAAKLLAGLFTIKNGMYKVKNLDESSLFDFYAGLPEIKKGSGIRKSSEDFITMKTPEIKMRVIK